MEKMLNELTSIVPPSSMLPNWSLSSTKSDGSRAESGDKGVGSEDAGTESEENDSLDMLALMRKRLEESLLDDTPDEKPLGQGSNPPQGLAEVVEGSGKPSTEDGGDELDAAINVLPPTPTITKEMLGSGNAHSQLHSQHLMDSLAVRGDASSTTTLGTTTTTTTTIDTTGLPLPIDAGVRGGLAKEEMTDQGPLFSPASSRNSPDLKKVCV